jgi:hypothetical protein
MPFSWIIIRPRVTYNKRYPILISSIRVILVVSQSLWSTLPRYPFHKVLDFFRSNPCQWLMVRWKKQGSILQSNVQRRNFCTSRTRRFTPSNRNSRRRIVTYAVKRLIPFFVSCRLNHLRANESAVIRIRSRVWNSTLVEEFPGVSLEKLCFSSSPTPQQSKLERLSDVSFSGWPNVWG